jgi:hypothetical protein
MTHSEEATEASGGTVATEGATVDTEAWGHRQFDADEAVDEMAGVEDLELLEYRRSGADT